MKLVETIGLEYGGFATVVCDLKSELATICFDAKAECYFPELEQIAKAAKELEAKAERFGEMENQPPTEDEV